MSVQGFHGAEGDRIGEDPELCDGEEPRWSGKALGSDSAAYEGPKLNSYTCLLEGAHVTDF